MFSFYSFLTFIICAGMLYTFIKQRSVRKLEDTVDSQVLLEQTRELKQRVHRLEDVLDRRFPEWRKVL